MLVYDGKSYLGIVVIVTHVVTIRGMLTNVVC